MVHPVTPGAAIREYPMPLDGLECCLLFTNQGLAVVLAGPPPLLSPLPAAHDFGLGSRKEKKEGINESMSRTGLRPALLGAPARLNWTMRLQGFTEQCMILLDNISDIFLTSNPYVALSRFCKLRNFSNPSLESIAKVSKVF